MSIIAAVLVFLFTSTDDADALRRTAPNDLTTEAAMEHLTSARMAAVLYGIDADMLLSTAYYESRYTSGVIGPVVSGKTACGVLQPTMETKCTGQTVFEDYLDGAKHLKDWYQACRGNERCALLGYGGGYALIKSCAEGPVMRERGGHDVDLCTAIPDTRQFRARWIKKERTKHVIS
jgi:hypothetical protein